MRHVGQTGTDEKRALRERVLGLRDALAPAVRADSSALIVTRLLELTAYTRASGVLAYMSFGSEWDTAAFVHAVLDDAKMLFLPRVNRAERRLEIYHVRDVERELRPGVWGIREPEPQCCEMGSLGAVDFILAPGVAFDAHGNRLGYGGGFYDRLLAAAPKHCARVAGAFSVQMVERVPASAHDERVQLIVTESTTHLAVAAKRSG